MYQMGLRYVKSRTEMRKEKQGKLITSENAASWLRQGGFSWQSEDEYENENEIVFVSKPRGLRANRKALACAKKGAMWADDDCGSD
jgi:hypothetical protein